MPDFRTLACAVVALLPLLGLVVGGVLAALAFNSAHPDEPEPVGEAVPSDIGADVSGM